MEYFADRPLVIQPDRTIYLEVNHPQYEDVRQKLQSFSDLIKSPEHIHTYRITPLSLWHAAARGQRAEDIISFLQAYAKFPLTNDVAQSIREDMDKYGQLTLVSLDTSLYLIADKLEALQAVIHYPSVSSFFSGEPQRLQWTKEQKWGIAVAPQKRGELKQQCMRLGFPITDEAGYDDGESLPCAFAPVLADGSPFQLRDYQREAVDAFLGPDSAYGGQGVLVLPCGAGKTIIGIAVMVRQQCATLILTSNETSVRQWKREILEKTTLTENEVGEYTTQTKLIKPVTIATYQMLTFRPSQSAAFGHMHLFKRRRWGLIIYDEVHLLPAPVYRATASLQSTRRLGLTATLVREDGREEDVFSLIGPKRYDLPWKELEHKGHIAEAICTAIRVDLDPALKRTYHLAPEKDKMRIAQENPQKLAVVKELLNKHREDQVLIIGQYVRQMEALGMLFKVPVITGKTKHGERDRLYAQFRTGEIRVLAVSKVANFAIDLPAAAVAIQVSGTYGSRQEEAQRLGRILRPKPGENKAYFYHIVTKDSKDQDYALKRQLFLVEQGYRYHVVDYLQDYSE
ncbi:type III restriction protein res subunit [Caldalkalibacillus thermarum TA2.A1]|uniref:DNA 3'-5' helicase n=1 Tax=Caldalkalibacillus thermarum (strain TA2.A1) TaxID=986075 RepID=F5LAA3_CALTT|nr:DNA repair helicase XPB [Caldalkalibacillus thermarum]EGL81652.1 type III restriction protein res subunit [Caldalkalibacillus thermarum TA2.A1]